MVIILLLFNISVNAQSCHNVLIVKDTITKDCSLSCDYQNTNHISKEQINMIDIKPILKIQFIKIDIEQVNIKLNDIIFYPVKMMHIQEGGTYGSCRYVNNIIDIPRNE